MKIYLKTGIRYRKEQNYILLCDCINLTDYQLPLEFMSFLSKLTKGCDVNKIRSPKYKILVDDFYALGLITTKKNETVVSRTPNICLSYDEREFL